MQAVRALLPWVLRVLGWAASAALAALATLWVGIPTATRRATNHWMRQAQQAGIPIQYQDPLYYVVMVAVGVALVLGWVMLAFVTVWLVGLIFHF